MPSGTGLRTQHGVLKVHPCCSMCQSPILFYDQAISPRGAAPYFVSIRYNCSHLCPSPPTEAPHDPFALLPLPDEAGMKACPSSFPSTRGFSRASKPCLSGSRHGPKGYGKRVNSFCSVGGPGLPPCLLCFLSSRLWACLLYPSFIDLMDSVLAS